MLLIMDRQLGGANRGIIEGFFGRPWSWSARQAYASFLSDQQYQYYIYAPKADRYLRRLWSEPWPLAEYNHLQQLGETYHQAGLAWGIGITPFEIHLDFDDRTLAKLDAKIRSINNLQPDILAILFDDMRGDFHHIAQIQAAVTHRIMALSTASSFVMCPTYYSDDPVLDKIFGDRPADYLETLGELLEPAVDIFWTGEKVCSPGYSIEHLQNVTQRLGRKPFLWDNYPVNDGARMCQFLNLRPVIDRLPPLSQMTEWTAGQAINPMNQAYLSQIPLLTCAAAAWPAAVAALGGAAFASSLLTDLAKFQDQGLEHLDTNLQQQFISYYQDFHTPYSQEIVDWLRGEYPFDPTCLTD
jgi:hyaluronoglucosaminidase